MDQGKNVPQLVETKVCDACGTQIWVYDPPIEFDVKEACGVVNPETNRECHLVKDHTGKHYALIEEVESWE